MKRLIAPKEQGYGPELQAKWSREPGKQPGIEKTISEANDEDDDDSCIKRQSIHTSTASSAISRDFRRFRSKPKYIIDIFAGDNSLAKYYLRNDPRCKIMCIDIKYVKRSSKNS